ncbi:methyl-accepting chemotaxis protein [Paenibacillus endophyticus]|uniref:Methyl-accepting chemotaxis protein n=1 Tax=Paenibacillus endophyticus TaxID=1294268 RepID=A0A7W5C867_9BACL|nr:HAMP domain-containing methyl-accepting chemotaxis protein [Paenibacillus endophyticus]MBB3152923.1 methyl-accepting chemotaxis protein [Paenibacillus endophyticus]
MKLSLRFRLAMLSIIPLAFYAYTGLYLLGEERSLLDQMTEGIYETSSRVDSLILNADRDMYQAYQAYLQIESGTLDQASADAAREELAQNIKQVDDRVTEAQAILFEKGMQTLAEGESKRSIDQILIEFRANYNFWTEAAVKAAADGVSKFQNSQIDSSFQKSRSGIDEIGQSIAAHTDLTISSITKDLDESQLTLFISILLVTVVLGIFVFFTIRHIMKTIKSVVFKTQRVAEGDLTVIPDVKYSKDELGSISRSVDHMIEAMSQLIKGIADNAAEVTKSTNELTTTSKESAAAAEHVAHNINEVANGSEVQARGAEETSRAIEEMTIGIQRIAENTASIADKSTSTSEQASQGHDALLRLITQMDEVSTVINKLSATIGTLEHRSKEIGAIADNITTFANQTNILSLNASIEAARAGEHGRGFAVVAGEIRKLAAGSLASAEGIHQLVDETRTEITGASAYMAQTVEEVDRGSERVRDVRQNLDIIIASITQMSEQIHENSAITQQMSASSEQVSASMEQTASTAAANLEKTESVAAATEEQLALMDNISSSASHLNEIVIELDQAISHFKVK